MPAPTALAVTLDRDEYSRLEDDRRIVTLTITPTGTGLSGEQLTVQLRKARRARDVIVASFTETLAGDGVHTATVDLASIVDDTEVPLVRRGGYFVRVSSVTAPAVVGTSSDFRVSLVTVSRLRRDYLHGTNQRGFDILFVRDQPQDVTGVEVTDVSAGHPQAWFPLSYRGPVGTVVLSGTADAGSTVTVVTWTGGGLVVNAHVGRWLTSGTDHREIVSNTASAITVSPGFPSAPAATTDLQIQENTDRRFLSWCSGPEVELRDDRTRYVLRKSSSEANPNDTHYIEVRVNHALLPEASVSETLIVLGKPMEDAIIREIVERSISWFEDVAVGAFVEPTRIISGVAAEAAVAVAGTSVPSFPAADWDDVRTPLTYYVPQGATNYITIKFPYYPIVDFADFFGRLQQERVLEVPLEWIQAAPGGFIELVPFTLEALGRFVGVLLFQSLRGHIPIPNFWNYDMRAGFVRTPPIVVELVAKKAAMDVLTIAGQAYRGGFSSQSVSQDGVSQSVSYTASAMFGIYSATIADYKKFIDEEIRRFRGAYRGVNLQVL